MASSKLALVVAGGLATLLFMGVIAMLHDNISGELQQSNYAVKIDSSNPLVLGGHYKGKSWR